MRHQKLTWPSANSVFSIVLGDKKSRVRRFFAVLSLNQSFSGSGNILSPFFWLHSGTFSRFPRSAELRARTVGVMRRAESCSVFSMSGWAQTGSISAHPHPHHISGLQTATEMFLSVVLCCRNIMSVFSRGWINHKSMWLIDCQGEPH